MSQLRFRADVAGDTHERDADTHDRAAHHAVALSTRNRASASRPHRSLRRLEARDSTRDEAAFHQHTCLPTLVVTRDMAHSELKAYSSNEETEDSHEDEINDIAQLPRLSPGMRRVDSLELHRLKVPTRAPRRKSRLEPKEPAEAPPSYSRKIFSMLGLSHAVKE